MPECPMQFDNAAAYEQIMGRWTRAVGAIFLEWLAPQSNVRWLDVGCGTGVFTDLIAESCSPAVLTAIDPAPAQIDYARHQPIARRVDFQAADAQALPFPDASFDVVVSALVINFIPDRAKALAEMRRVARVGGTVAAYVWDFAGEGSPGSILRSGLRAIGVEPPDTPGTAHTTLAALHVLFQEGGFQELATREINVTSRFESFDDLWRAQTPRFNPLTNTVCSLSETARGRLMEEVRARVVPGPGASVAYSARAHAIKARVPA